MPVIRSLKIWGSVCACLISSSAISDNYQFQARLQGVASEGDFEEFQENSYRAGSLQAVVYLSPVELVNGPWEQAGFFNKSSYIGVQKISGTLEREALVDVSDANASSAYEFRALDDIDVDVDTAFARYVFGNRITADLLFSKREEAADDSSYDKDTAGLTIGSFVGLQHWWGLSYQRLTVSHHWEETEHDVHAYGLRGHHVLLEKDRLAVSIEYGLQIENGREIDDATGVFANFTFYLNDRLGLDFGVNVRDEENRDVSSVDIGAEYFIVPQLSGGLHLIAHQINYSNTSIDYVENGILVELVGRY